jgi:8-oxo-dGTP pyrophosphatase MutT (NUDIX family)
MTIADRVQRIRTALSAPLPGHDGFMVFSGYPRPDVQQALAQQPPPRESAVLALLYPKQDVLHTLLMLRPTYDGVHSGQVGFPGGKREVDDASLMHTALREFGEETGAWDTPIEVLGSLSPVYIPPSRSLVTPYVGYAEQLGTLIPDPREVELLIETPLDRLLDAEALRRGPRFVQVLGREMDVTYFDVQGHVVWGATAMMLAELRELLLRNG